MPEVPRRKGPLKRSVVASSSGRDSRLCKPSFKISGDVIEADAAEADGGFVLPAGGGDDDDGMLAIEHGAGPRGVLAAEADVDAARQMRGGEFGRIARVENLRADCLQSPAARRAASGFISRARAWSSVGRSWLLSTAS